MTSSPELVPPLPLSLPRGSDFSVEDCFSIDDAPARTADCISWGPHNVLQVCTRWSVLLYLNHLVAPAHQQVIRHHPLCHRSDTESVEVVVGAKWSTTLLPEVFYPACARLCVQTTNNLVVFRVARHGANRVQMSHGVGIACGRSGMPAAGASSSAGSPSAAASADAPLAALWLKTDKVKKAEPKARSRATAAKTARAPAAKKATTSRATKRRRKDSSSSSSEEEEEESSSVSSSSDSSSESSDSDSESDSETRQRRRRGATRAAAQGRQKAKDEENDCAAVDADDGADAGVIDYVWLSHDDLLVLSTRGLHIVSFFGDLSDDDAPQSRPLPPPLFSWGSAEDTAALGFRVPVPTCLSALSTNGLAVGSATATALAFLRRTVIVAAPFVLRVLHITHSSPGAPRKPVVRLVQAIEVAPLRSVPVALCAASIAVRHDAIAPAQPAEEAVELVVLIAAPCMVLRGRFLVPLGGAPRRDAPSCRGVWTPEAHYRETEMMGEVSLRKLTVVPLTGEAAAALADSVASDASGRVSPPLSVSTAILGVGERAMYLYLTSGPSSTSLFQCPLLAGCDEMPSHACAGISGVALHPSGTLAVAAVQTGHVKHEPLHLWPVSADGHGSWLRRLVELSGMLSGGDTADGHVSAATASPPGGESAVCVAAPQNTQQLLRSQSSSSFFLREQLLPGAVAHSSELHLYAQTQRATRALPSTDALKRYRASRATCADAALSQLMLRSPIVDLELRQRYLQLRAEHGIALFLRSPLPLSQLPVEDERVVAANVRGAVASSWPWWRLLRHVWSSCPWDTSVLHELILSNAICILARRYGFANMRFGVSERFRERGAAAGVAEDSTRCSTDPDTVDVDGAKAFVKAYVQHHEEALRAAAAATAAPNAAADKSSTAITAPAISSRGSLRFVTVLDCAPSSARDSKTAASTEASQLHWCISAAWVSALQEFLTRLKGDHKEVASPLEQAEVRFPCSLCDRADAVSFHLSLSTTSVHVPNGADGDGAPAPAAVAAAVPHTTLFSGTTLSPLSFYATDYVLTRCLSCGLSDYADGPLCRICGGLLE